jgi:hypothetical protein
VKRGFAAVKTAKRSTASASERFTAKRLTGSASDRLLSHPELHADHQERVVHVPLVFHTLAQEIRQLRRDAQVAHHHIGANATMKREMGVVLLRERRGLVIPIELLTTAGEDVRLYE